MKKNSNFFERILQIVDYYDIKTINNFALNWLNYSSSEKINRLKKENTNPSYEILTDITNKFEEINAEWLLTGKGEMLKNTYIKPVEPENKVKESSPIYNKVDYKEKYYTLLEDYHKLNEENRELRKKTEKLNQKECGSTQSQKSKNNKTLLPV